MRLNFCRNSTYSFTWIVAVCFLSLSALSYAAAPKDPMVYFFNEFFGDLKEELDAAKEGKKKAIMLFFQQEECPFCYRMKQTILNRPDVQKYFRDNFLVFQVDIEGDIEISDFSGSPMTEKDFAFKKHRVRATPVIAFFDLTGKRVVKYIGAPSSTEEFLWLGEFVAEGHYKNKKYANGNFTRYKRDKRKGAVEK